MSKMKEFKQIALNVGKFIKKYWEYKHDKHKYFSMENMTKEDIDLIKDELTLKFHYSALDEITLEDFSDSKEVFVNALMVESFYKNHDLFIGLTIGKKIDEIESEFNAKVIFKTVSDYVGNYNKQELIKNIQSVNDIGMNCLVLQNALMNCNEDLFDTIMPYLQGHIQNNKEKIVKVISLCIAENGQKIKNSLMGNKVVQLINDQHLTQDIIDLYCTHKINNKKEENINTLLNIDIVNMNIKEKIKTNDFNIGQLTLKKAQKLLLEIKQDATYNDTLFMSKIKQYLEKEHNTFDLKKKIQFLRKENMINEIQLDNIIENAHPNLLKKFFNEYKTLVKELSSKKIEIILEKYKNKSINFDLELKDHINFLQKYPYKLEKDEVLKLITHSYQAYHSVSTLEIKARKLIEEKYNSEIDIENSLPMYGYKILVKEQYNNTKKLLTLLYKKYPEYMDNIETLISFSESNTQKDVFLSEYLKIFFADEKNAIYKKDIVSHLNIFNGNSMAKYGHTLQWVIDNDLLDQLISTPGKNTKFDIFADNISQSKMWAPLLIEQYNVSPDTVIKQTIKSLLTNNTLFSFVIKHYTLMPETEQEICNIILATDNSVLATEVFKKGIVLNDYDEQKYQLFPTETGQILLKSRLKHKLENMVKEDKKKSVKKI